VQTNYNKTTNEFPLLATRDICGQQQVGCSSTGGYCSFQPETDYRGSYINYVTPIKPIVVYNILYLECGNYGDVCNPGGSGKSGTCAPATTKCDGTMDSYQCNGRYSYSTGGGYECINNQCVPWVITTPEL
jgi:hypothetical protein